MVECLLQTLKVVDEKSYCILVHGRLVFNSLLYVGFHSDHVIIKGDCKITLEEEEERGKGSLAAVRNNFC